MISHRKTKSRAGEPQSRRRSRPTRGDIVAAYEMLLGRTPESEAAIEAHLESGSFSELIRGITASAEYAARTGRSPFFYYNSDSTSRA